MHIGKGLCVALIIVQIPGASGLYPIEMMPKFFRMVYPFVPFSYSIDAFRETIAGFYDGHWLKSIGALLMFAVVAFFIGLAIRPLLVNLNRLFARQIKESDMIIGEEVQLPERGYNVSQAIQVLADKGGYREAIEERASRFAELYPKLKRGALVAGFIVPVILVLIFSFTNGEKIVVLATWMHLGAARHRIPDGHRIYAFQPATPGGLGSLSDRAIREQLVERQAGSCAAKRAQQIRRDKLMRKAQRRKHETKQAIANVADTSQADADGIATLVQAMNATGNTGTASNTNPNGNSERSNA